MAPRCSQYDNAGLDPQSVGRGDATGRLWWGEQSTELQRRPGAPSRSDGEECDGAHERKHTEMSNKLIASGPPRHRESRIRNYRKVLINRGFRALSGAPGGRITSSACSENYAWAHYT